MGIQEKVIGTPRFHLAYKLSHFGHDLTSPQTEISNFPIVEVAHQTNHPVGLILHVFGPPRETPNTVCLARSRRGWCPLPQALSFADLPKLIVGKTNATRLMNLFDQIVIHVRLTVIADR